MWTSYTEAPPKANCLNWFIIIIFFFLVSDFGDGVREAVRPEEGAERKVQRALSQSAALPLKTQEVGGLVTKVGNSERLWST